MPLGPPQASHGSSGVAHNAAAKKRRTQAEEEGAEAFTLGTPSDPDGPLMGRFVISGEARSGAGCRVRNASTGKYVFQSFREQLKQQLQQGLPGGGQLSALDVMDASLLRERQRWKRLREETQGEAREEQAKRIEVEECNFTHLVKHILQGVEARGPARQLLVHLCESVCSLPLLLLHQQQVVDELLLQLRNEETYGVALRLLPALAKDLRWRFLSNLETCVAALHLLLFDLEERHDADGVQLLFQCLSQIFRYLHKYLTANIEDFLDILLPLLLHTPPGLSTQNQKLLPQDGDHQPQPPQQQDQNQQQQQRQQQRRRKRQEQRQHPPQAAQRSPRLQQQQQQRQNGMKLASASLLAAQAAASVLRRISDEETFYACVSAVVKYFLVVPPRWLPVFSACAARVFFECIRGFDAAFSRGFEGLSCFLIANVLLRQPFAVPTSGETYEPPRLEPPPSAAEDTSSGSSSSSSRSCGRQVYAAQAQCVCMYLDHARMHAASTDSPAAIALQRVTLSFLTAALHAALRQVQPQEELQQQELQKQQQQERGEESEEAWHLLTASFSPYFSLHPFRPLTSFPYFTGEAKPLACRATAVQPCSARCLPPAVLVGFCCLADAAASWFAATPRSTGAFDDYIQRLIEGLLPFCKVPVETPQGPAAAEASEGQQQQLALPTLLQPLLLTLPDGTNWTAAAAIGLLLPCSILRLFVSAWRAVPISYAHAVTLKGNPLLHLLPATLAAQRSQLHQLQRESPVQLAELQWQRGLLLERMAEICCSGLRMLLVAPAPADGFASLCLRCAVDFLAGQPPALLTALEGRAALPGVSLKGKETPDLLLAEFSSWRWAAASSLFAVLLEAFGRDGREAATSKTAATIRLLLPLHFGGQLKGTCLELRRLEASLKNFLFSVSQASGELGGEERRAYASHLRSSLARAFAGLNWLWELQKTVSDVSGESATPASRVELAGEAGAAAVELQQQQQQVLCLLLEALQHVPNRQESHTLQESLLLFFGRIFVTFISLPRLVICRDGSSICSCPYPPAAFVESCAARLGEAAGACSATAIDAKALTFQMTEETRLSVEELETARRYLVDGGTAAAAATEADEEADAALCPSAEARWVDCLLSVLVAASVFSARVYPAGANEKAATPSLPASPALVKCVCLALKFSNVCVSADETPTCQQQQVQQQGLYLMAIKALLPNLSSGSPQLRLWSLRFISRCDPKLLLSCSRCNAFVCSSSCMHSVYGSAKEAENVICSLLQRLETLEGLQVNLETERRKIQFLHGCAKEVQSIQETVAAAEAAGKGCRDPACGGLLLLLQLAYRVLLAGLSVKFATVWPEAVEAISGCLKAFHDFNAVKCQSTSTASAADTLTKQNQRSSLPYKRQQKNAALAFVWELVVCETHRTLRELEQKQQDSLHPFLPSKQKQGTAGGTLSTCREWVEETWENASAEQKSGEETAALERHSHLLRILKRFATRFGKDAFPSSKKQQQKQLQNEQQKEVDVEALADPDGPQQTVAVSAPSWRQNFAQRALRFLLQYGQQIAAQLTRSPGNVEEAVEAGGGENEMRFSAAMGKAEISGDTSAQQRQQMDCSALQTTANLIPRAHDVLRAILAHGEMRFPSSGGKVLGFVSDDSHVEGEQRETSDEERELEALWSQFLATCTQHLISVRDASLQSLVLQTLMLCKELQPMVRPYLSVLEEAIQDKRGTPNALLRLILGKEEAKRQLLQPSAGNKDDVLLVPEHRPFILPLIVRLLLSKTQIKLGRSPGSVLASRRRIFGLLSSLEETEIPMVLAVLTLRLVRLTPRDPRASSPSQERAQGLQDPPALEGVDKERALIAFVNWLHSRAQATVGLSPLSANENEGLASVEPPVNAALSQEVLRPSSSIQLHGILKSVQQLAQMQRQVLRCAAPFLVFLFAEVLRHLVPVGDGACAPTADELQETVEGERGAADAQQGEPPTAASDDAGQSGGAAAALSDAAKDGGEVAGSTSTRHKKHCVRIALDTLHLLLSSFPDLAVTWKLLLSPAAPALQLLLSAAVETGAAGHVADANNSAKSPAIVRLVASWASQSECFILYEELLPKALPTLLGALGSHQLVRYLQRSKRSTTPLVEAAIDTALLLSFGGRTQEQQDEEMRLARRQFNAMKQVNERRRQSKGYHSSSSEEESDGEEKTGAEFVEDDKAKSLTAFRETYEALQQQHEQRQKQGMRVLLPQIGLLLHSIEMLLNARRAANVPSRSSGVEDTTDGLGVPVAEGAIQPALHRRDRALLVGFKELQLLTRLASYACSPKEGLQHQEPSAHSGFLTAAKLIRLLLLSLPLRVRSGGAAARQQLTLSAIKGLLPAVACWRRILAPSPSASNEVGELRELLRGLHRSCCGLLDSAEDLQCRAAAAEVLLATELAASGCQVTEETLETQIRGFALKQLAASRRAEEAGEGAEAAEAAGVSWLLPGGAMNKRLLEDALPSLFLGDGESVPSYKGWALSQEWRVSVALVLVCANLLKSGGGLAPEEQKPDVDMQVMVLLALVEKHLTPPALEQPSQEDPVEVRTQKANQGQQEDTQEKEKSKEKKTEAEHAQKPKAQEQAGKRRQLHLPASALEPLMHHVVYLLSDCSDDLTLQHVALTVIRKASVALGAAASAAATRRAAFQFAAQPQQAANEEETETDWNYAVCMQQHITKILIPHLRRLLRSLKEDRQRMALRAFDAIIRTLGPAGPLLPPVHLAVAADDAEDSALFLSEADEARRNMRLHLDLYALLTPATLTPAVQEAAALAQQLVASGDASGAAAAAAKAAELEALASEFQASEREGGGDVLLELLHMQKHRRAKGLQLLSKAATTQQLCQNTLRHFCLPLAMSAVLQANEGGDAAGRRKGAKASRHYAGRTEPFSQQMAEQGVACLAQACTRLSLKWCTQTLRQLVTHLANVPQREAFIHRAIAATIKAFPFGLVDAVQQTLSHSQMEQHQEQQKSGDFTAPRDSNVAVKHKETFGEQQQQGEQKDPLLSVAAEAEEEASSADEASNREDAAGVVSSHSAAEKRKLNMEACIRDELIPMLYRLAFGNKVRRVTSKDGAGEEPGKTLEANEGKKYENPVVHTELVAVLSLLARLLPPKEFHLQLPRLVRTIAFSLKSRERDARRGARVALTHLAVNLGFPYFAYLATELQRMLGPKSEKDAAANQQGFLRPVLLFTLHAMLNSLLQQHPSTPEAPVIRAAEEASTVDGTAFIQRFEAAVPMLLPLIAEEVNRVADPDSLEQEERRRTMAGRYDGEEAFNPTSTSLAAPDDGSKRFKVEEAQTLKGPPMLLLLAKDTSSECLAEHLLPFVLGLLTGTSCKREGWSRGAAFSGKYVHRVEDLLLHFVLGLSRNKNLSLEKKLRTAKQLLILTVATLQFPLLHPVLQAERSLDESLYLLARQQLLVLDKKNKKRGKKGSTSCASKEEEPQDCMENVTQATQQEAQEERPEMPLSLSPSHQEDLRILRLLLLPEAKDEDAGFAAQQAAAAAPPPHHRGDLATQHSRKLLVSLLKQRMERRVTLQPGVATGRSLMQATRNKSGPGEGGLDLPTRASVLGTAALRLLHLVLKTAKAPLRQCRNRQLGELQQRDSIRNCSGELGEAALQQSLSHLDELAVEVVCCFSCKATKLVSWGARCLLELLSLRLPRLENRGALVAYLTMRIFHSCGSSGGVPGADSFTSRSELLPICTKLLAVLLLQPQASKWMENALNPSQHVGGDILRALLREQLRVLPWRHQDQLLQQKQKQHGTSAAAFSQADMGFSASLAVTEEQIQAAGQFFLREALFAHISSSLEDSQLQLCALFLFKRVVLQHYKDLAGEAARRALEESREAPGAMDTKALQRHAQRKRRRDANAAEREGQGEKHSTAAAELLPLVYECVDRVARVMVQHASSSGVSRKLANICADVYVSFLLNFPMTPKLQQRRVFFLLQQQKFSDVYGRRAAIAALHKVVRRFPAELFLERYGEVALLTCSSTLATEADKTAHAMLREVMNEVLALSEVADDPRLHLHGFLKTISKVFLLPRTQHLVALLEFLSVFVTHVARDAPQASLAAYLPAVLLRLSAVSSLAAGMQQPGEGDLSGDWRLVYKAFLVLEQLMGSGGLPLMEEGFAKFVKVVGASSSNELLSLTAAATSDTDETERQVIQQRELEALLTNLEVWEPSAARQKKQRSKADGGQQHLITQQQQQIYVGLHAAHLWKKLAGSGLRHENAWVRCAALRCVGNYLQHTPLAVWRRADSASLACMVVCRRKLFERKHGSTQSSPVTELGLCLGQHFGTDTMLERHPNAAPYAIAALISWARLAFTFPHLTPVSRNPRSSGQAKQRRTKGVLRGREASKKDLLEGNCAQPIPNRADEKMTSEFESDDKSGVEDAAVVVAGGDCSATNAADEEKKDGEAADEKAAAASAASFTGEAEGPGIEGEADEQTDEDAPSTALDDEEEAEGGDGGGEAAELVMQEMHEEASKDDLVVPLAPSAMATPSAPFQDTKWNISLPEENASGAAVVSEELHPLVFLAAGLNRWLRVHLGRLGYTGDALPGPGAPPGTVVRVAGILTFFCSLLKLLPLGEVGGASKTAAASPPSARSVLLKVLRHIIDAAYRCSTLSTELAADSIMTQLIEENTFSKGEPAKPPAESTPSAGESPSLWGRLRGLNPVAQLKEVATGGAAVLRRMEQLLRSSGLDDVYSMLLADTRQSVSAKRVLRKLKVQQTFLENPQAHAQRKRRRNQAKGLQRKAKLRQAIFRRRGLVKRKLQA